MLNRPADIVFNELYVCFSRVESINNITFIKTNKAIYFKNPRRSIKCISAVKTSDNVSLVSELNMLLESLLKKENDSCPASDIILDQIPDKTNVRKLAEMTGLKKSTVHDMQKRGLTKEQILNKYCRNGIHQEPTYFYLMSSWTYRDKTATDYFIEKKVKNMDDFNKIMKFDHCMSKFKNNYRKDSNYVCNNAIMLDFDDNALEIDAFIERYKPIEFYLATSKSHNKDKHGKIEPRYHIYLPLRKEITDITEYRLVMESTMDFFKTTDTNCKNASRYFNGNREPDRITSYNNGKSITDFIQDIYNGKLKTLENQKKNESLLKQMYIDLPSNNEDCKRYVEYKIKDYGVHEGSRNIFMCHLAGCCKAKRMPVRESLLHANAKIGLPDDEVETIIKYYN
jgi:hypothetical protein